LTAPSVTYLATCPTYLIGCLGISLATSLAARLATFLIGFLGVSLTTYLAVYLAAPSVAYRSAY